LYLVGGNVANSVVMRKLMLDRTGLLELPKANAAQAQSWAVEQRCSPGQEEECNLNRQDWAALLKLTATNSAPAFNSTAPLPPPPDEPIPAAVTH
ncbi:MAG: DUF2272 domain-containing protein, partial [Stenotrophomonas sp.]